MQIQKPGMEKVAMLIVLQILLVLITCSYIRSDDNNSIGCVEEDRQALLSLKHNFKGPYVHRLHSWQGHACCAWNGIGCDRFTGRVSTLDLRAPYHIKVDIDPEDLYSNGWKRLVADEVNTSLMKLKYLKYLDLSGNNFKGSSIPESMGEMKGLTYLNLSCAGFVGRVPNHLGNLSNLKFLDLGRNYYDYSYNMLYVDDLSWLYGLSSLQHLDMGGVDLSNVAPKLMLHQLLTHLHSLLHLCLSFTGVDITYLFTTHPSSNSTFLPPTLRYLDLSFNSFYAPIPDSIQNLTSLEVLDLSSNLLNSTVPLWLGNLKKLESLHLANNELNSPDDELCLILTNLSNLHSLDLSYNQFSGIIPTSIGRSISSLISLDLSNNHFRGIIPPLGALTALTELSLSNNKLTRAIPSSLWRLSALSILDLSNNKLNGTISTSLGQLSNLITLDLSNNELNGVIPKSLGQLVNLRELLLSSNVLEGVFSFEYDLANLSNLTSLSLGNNHLITLHSNVSWLPPFQLQYLGLRSCKFEPTQFPTWLRTQNRINELDLSNTSISDTFPLWFFEDKPFLYSLDLSHNQIKGPLPCNIVNGSSYLMELILSGNMLSGNIHNCFLNNQYLQIVDLSLNQLSGTIPNSFQNMTSLMWLLLSNNNLTGPIPLGITNLTNLLALDLGYNRLSGRIPTWTGKGIPLQVLNLRNNMLSEIIPPQLCLLSFLQILDLANNDLQGSLPTCLGNLMAMRSLTNFEHAHNMTLISYNEWDKSNISQVLKGKEMAYSTVLRFVFNIDLSGNKLSGSIPQQLTKLSKLVGLNLARNQLSGSIPKNMGDLMSLQSLDLSHNQLSGEIPDTLMALTFLSYLNLSSNNLEGKVPQGNQLQTLDDPSLYEGNPHLCGSPLLQACPENNPATHDQGGDATNKDEDSDLEKMWFYTVVMVGYAIGFWAVVGVLMMKKSLRHAYFTYVDEVKDNIYVAVVVKMGALKKKMKKREGSQPQ